MKHLLLYSLIILFYSCNTDYNENDFPEHKNSFKINDTIIEIIKKFKENEINEKGVITLKVDTILEARYFWISYFLSESNVYRSNFTFLKIIDQTPVLVYVEDLGYDSVSLFSKNFLQLMHSNISSR